MNRPTPTATATNWLAGIFAAALLLMVWHLAEQDADTAQRMRTLSEQTHAADQRLQQAAADVCTAAMGPGTQALWTADGDLVCRPAVLTAEVAE